MDRAALRARARTLLDDAVKPYLWSDDFINDALEEAQHEANLRARHLVDSTTPAVCSIDVVGGQATYPLHPAVIVVRRAEWRATGMSQSTALERMSFDELDRTWRDWRDVEGTPVAIVQDLGAGVLRLYPTPVLPGTLTLTVWRRPTEDEALDADAVEPAIPPHAHKDLVHWVCAQAYSVQDAEMNDPQAADRAMFKFEAAFGQRPTEQMLRRLAVDRVGDTNSYFY